MTPRKRDQPLSPKPLTALARDIHAFLIDRRASSVSHRTINLYSSELERSKRFFESVGISDVESIRPTHLRGYLLHLGEHHNPGGVHIAYRVLKTFLRWWERETEPEGWGNPIHKVKPPKVPLQPLEPVSLDALRLMLKTCHQKAFTDTRDRAILMALLDTGLRATEFLSLNIADANLQTGAVLLRVGKGGKSRVVFLGDRCRREINRYLRYRAADPSAPLWVTVTGTRLTYAGLRQVVRRRAMKAGVPEPGLHAFRRGFALYSLRGGADIHSLQKLMGHADLTVLHRYLKQSEDDLRAVHQRAAPVDRLL